MAELKQQQAFNKKQKLKTKELEEAVGVMKLAIEQTLSIPIAKLISENEHSIGITYNPQQTARVCVPYTATTLPTEEQQHQIEAFASKKLKEEHEHKEALWIVRLNHRPTKKSGPELEFVFKLASSRPQTKSAKKNNNKKNNNANSKQAKSTNQPMQVSDIAKKIILSVLDEADVKDAAKREAILSNLQNDIQLQLCALKNSAYAQGMFVKHSK